MKILSPSRTGVLFSRDPSTGENKLYGEYLIDAQARSPHEEREKVCVCMCVSECERESVREKVCVRERECVCVREKEQAPRRIPH
jgi:hypothetical protein